MKKFLLVLTLFGLVYGTDLGAQNSESYQFSTHILDIHKGEPASGVSIILYKWEDRSREFIQVDSSATDKSGRIANFLPQSSVNDGIYKLKFETFPYFSSQSVETIYPYIEVVFQIKGTSHYHIPIMVSANGYSTYRGS